MIWLWWFAIALAGDGPSTAPAPAKDPAAAAPSFDSYAFVLLRKGPNWSADDTPENRALMKGHLAHFTAMEKAGHLLLAGPFSDQPDEDIRGLCIYRTSVEEARGHAEADPRVKAGHLRAEVMTLWTGAGKLAFPLAPPVPPARP